MSPWLMGACFLFAFLVGLYTISRKQIGWVRYRRWFLFAGSMLALWLAMDPPEWTYHRDQNAIWWITDGAEQVFSEQFLDTTGYPVIDSEETYFKSEAYPFRDSIHIVGHGLPPEVLEGLKGYPMRFHPSDPDTGIIAIYTPSTIYARSPWILSGKIHPKGSLPMFLLTPSGQQVPMVVDSLGTFQVEINSAVPGHLLYELQWVSRVGDTLREWLPVHILPEQKFSALALASSPSFELNYLKNYWVRQGHGWAARIRISSSNFQTQFVNVSKTTLDPNDPNRLANFDLFWVDVETWNGLTRTTQDKLLTAVSEGASLLVHPQYTAAQIARFPYHRISIRDSETWKIGRNKEVTIPQVRVRGSEWREIDFEGHAIAYYQEYGLGRIGILGWDQSFQLLLQDASTLYQDAWAHLLSEFYFNFDAGDRIISDPIIFANQLTTTRIMSSSDSPRYLIQNDTFRIPLLSVPYIPNLYEAVWWPRRGWNTLSDSSGQLTYTLFGQDPNSWQSWQQSRRITQNQWAADQKSTLSPIHSYSQPLPSIWFWLISLILFGMLWLDERLVG